MPQEPQILIKKADGTTARVPLSSLQKKNDRQKATDDKQQNSGKETKNVTQSSITPPKAASPLKSSNQLPILNQSRATKKPRTVRKPRTVNQEPGTVKEPRTKNQELPQIATPHELTNTTPVTEYFTDLARSHEWDKADHRSLLEEAHPPLRSEALSIDRYEDVEAVLKGISFSFPKELHGRLHSLIQSRIKEVRSDAQVKEYAMRPQDTGGLGLQEDHADALIAAVHERLHVQNISKPPQPKRRITKKARVRAPSSAATSHTSIQPASKSAPPIVRTQKKPSMHDVVAPNASVRALGPIDEVRQMSVDVFRGLGATPQEQGDVIRKKVATLKQETYVDFISGIEAWFVSPIYRAYEEVLQRSLDTGVTVGDVLSDQNTGMSGEEFGEIAKLNQEFRF